MITSHTEARDYCCTVLDLCGAPRLVRDRVEQIITDQAGRQVEGGTEPYGVLAFASNQGLSLVDELEGAYGHTKVSVGYTLPIEPHDLKRRIIHAYHPQALSWMKARGVTD